MKLRTLFALLVCSIVLVACNVTETIVFDENMGGTYKNNFDFSTMMMMAKEGRPDNAERKVREVIDTTIVFDDLFVEFKDSIAALPLEERQKLEAMRGAVIDMHMDEDKGVFDFSVTRKFTEFDELEGINEQLDGALDLAQAFGKKDNSGGPSDNQMDELTKTDVVEYFFAGNTFKRIQPEVETPTEIVEEVEEVIIDDEVEVEEVVVEDEEENAEENLEDLNEMIKAQFEELFKATYYTMVYTFPKPIKSVSSEDAIISDDRKTMTLKVNMSESNEDKSLLDLVIILED